MPPLLKANLSEFADVRDGSMTTSMDAPWVLARHSAITAWADNPKVAMSLANFGSQYRKSLDPVHGKGQLPMFKQDAKEETDHMFKQILGKVSNQLAFFNVNSPDTEADTTNIIKSVTEKTFLYGVEPSRASVGGTPHGMGIVKLMAAGSMKHVLIHQQSYIKALGRLPSKGGLKADLEKLTLQEAKLLMNSGCRIEGVQVGPKEMLFIPTGWSSMEISVQGALVYGVRKSVCHVSSQSLDDLSQMLEIYDAAQMNTANAMRVKLIFLKTLKMEDEAAALEDLISQTPAGGPV